MQPLKALKEFFDPPASETHSEKLGRHIDALKKRSDFFIFDGTRDNDFAKTTRVVPMVELINKEPARVYSIDLMRITARRPQGGDRVVLQGTDNVKRLYVMYDIRETDNFPALAPVLRAVPVDGAEYKGGFGLRGQYNGEHSACLFNDAASEMRLGTSLGKS